MKKTFTINISGSIFHIEEDGYEKLQEYLLRLSQHFDAQPGGQEILQDIEARIAELLQQKIAEKHEAVTIEWVEDVMHRMGNPEDFEETEQTGTAQNDPKVEKTKKRMYRDPENRVLGGVCSGMGAYFNIDPVFLRILFVLLVFLGAGISVIIYLVFWVIVPAARTTAQRLEMKGEEPTISTIQKTIQEEVKDVKSKFSQINKSEAVRRGREISQKAGDATARTLRRLGRAFAVFTGAVLIFIGFISFVTFLVSMAVGGSIMKSDSGIFMSDVDFSNFLGFFVSPTLVSISILLVVLVVGIPLLALLFIGTKLVFRYKTNNKLIGLGAFGIWLAALVSAIALAFGQVNNYKAENSVSEIKPIACGNCQTLYLQPGEFWEGMDSENNFKYNDFDLANINGKTVLASHPNLKLEATDASDFSIIVKRKSRGKNLSDIQENLKKINYELNTIDSTLTLSPYFTLADDAKWRSQDVQVIVKVPKGKMVYLGKNLDQIEFDFENINNLWGSEMTGKTWIMTNEGLKLKE